MRRFECVVVCSHHHPLFLELQITATLAAQAEGFLPVGEDFPEGSLMEVHKNEKNPLAPTLVVLVPEESDQIDKFESLLEGVDIGDFE